MCCVYFLLVSLSAPLMSTENVMLIITEPNTFALLCRWRILGGSREVQRGGDSRPFPASPPQNGVVGPREETLDSAWLLPCSEIESKWSRSAKSGRVYFHNLIVILIPNRQIWNDQICPQPTLGPNQRIWSLPWIPPPMVDLFATSLYSGEVIRCLMFDIP